MEAVKPGDTVSVHYTGKLEDGRVFDSTEGRDPLVFTLGEDQTIAGFEDAVLGMRPGETRSVRIPSEKAYGPRREEMLIEMGRDRLPGNVEPKIGQHLRINQKNGLVLIVTITDITDSSVTVDANHPLAGKDLLFDIRLVRIV
jgi:peptidylprolyl isomerase